MGCLLHKERYLFDQRVIRVRVREEGLYKTQDSVWGKTLGRSSLQERRFYILGKGDNKTREKYSSAYDRRNVHRSQNGYQTKI